MYKITASDGAYILTDKVEYIRRHPSGIYLRTDRNRAEGVEYGGQFYMWDEGANLCEIDSADELRRLAIENETLRNQLAEAEEVAIDLYEANLVQESINAQQDEAIIDIYELMEEMNNG